MNYLVPVLTALALLVAPSLSAAQPSPDQVLQSAGQSDFVQLLLERRAQAGQQPEMSAAQEEQASHRRDQVQAALDRYDADKAAADTRRLQCAHACEDGYQQCWAHNSKLHEVCMLRVDECRMACNTTYNAEMAGAQSRWQAVRGQR